MVRETDLGATVARQLRHVPAADRDDAVQVAWLAFLESRDPARAVDTWRRVEARRRARERTNHEGN